METITFPTRRPQEGTPSRIHNTRDEKKREQQKAARND